MNCTATLGEVCKNIVYGVTAAAAATEAMVNSSLGESGSIISSLAQMNSRNSGQEGGQSKEKQSEGNFPPNDPSGDKTVSEMLKKSRDPQS